MSYFNRNFKYLRQLTKLSMSSLAKQISKRLNDRKSISVPQIQSYEGSTSAKYDVLFALRDLYREYDSNFTLEFLLERDLEAEGYLLPEEKIEEMLDISIKYTEPEIEDLRIELRRARVTIMNQAETIYLLLTQQKNQT